MKTPRIVSFARLEQDDEGRCIILTIKYLLLLLWAGHVARMEEGRSAFKILTGKPTGKRREA